MIAFTCKAKEKIVLPTLNVAIEVLHTARGAVRLGVEGPPEDPILLEREDDLANEERSAKGRCGDRETEAEKLARFMRPLCNRLKETALELGMVRLQLDMGMLEEVRTALAQIQDEFQLLRYGVEGEMTDLPAEPRPGARKARRALLVEDDRNERELLAGFLRHSGLKVDTAGDGADALDYLRTHDRPDVVLLDMGLPLVDGPTTVREIRRNPAFGGLKIIGVTGHLPGEFDLESGPRGIDRWFHKPLDPAVLLRAVAEELDGSLVGV